MAALEVEPILVNRITKAQNGDEELEKIKGDMMIGKAEDFREDGKKETIWFGKRICVPKDSEIRKLIFQAPHESPYSIHLGNTKMYMELKERFWWPNMKRDIVEYIARCDVCSRVKAEHQKPAGMLQPLPIPDWKWDKIGMDFIIGLPRTKSCYNSIWVVVDHFDHGRSFHSSKDHIHKCEASTAQHEQNRQFAWSSQRHCVR